jgi:hypothetical protein
MAGGFWQADLRGQVAPGPADRVVGGLSPAVGSACRSSIPVPGRALMRPDHRGVHADIPGA